MKILDNKFCAFWKTADVFSNWHPSKFKLWLSYCHTKSGSDEFSCAEQAMMYFKAILFEDNVTALEIMAASNPKDMKALGRKVKNYDEAEWAKNREWIMLEILRSKFSQNPHMMYALLSTTPLEIVEASPFDTIWGVGLGEDDPLILDKATWKGLNLLGKCLMQVRSENL